MGGASNSDQTTDTSGAHISCGPVAMVIMMMGSRDEVIATPNGSTTSTAHDSYVTK